MTNGLISRRPARRVAAGALSLALAALATTACNEDRASVLAPFGPIGYNSRFVKVATSLPQGVVSVVPADTLGNPATVTIRLNGLEALTGGVYQVWLAQTTGTATTGFVKATGNLAIIHTDTSTDANGDPVITRDTVAKRADVSSFSEGGPNSTALLTVTQATLGTNPLADNLVLVTVENAAGAASPGAAAPLWAQYSTAAANSAALKFGTFNQNLDSAYVFPVSGRGTASYRGNVLVVNDSGLARPPVGYFYAAYLITRDSLARPATVISLGPQTAPFPNRAQSLREADVQVIPGIVTTTPPAILAAANRLMADTVAALPKTTPFAGFAELVITLQNKLGDPTQLSPAIVLSAPVPAIVSKPNG